MVFVSKKRRVTQRNNKSIQPIAASLCGASPETHWRGSCDKGVISGDIVKMSCDAVDDIRN